MITENQSQLMPKFTSVKPRKWAPSGGEPFLSEDRMGWLRRLTKYILASSRLMPSLSLIRATMFLAVSIANIMFANSRNDHSESLFPEENALALYA